MWFSIQCANVIVFSYSVCVCTTIYVFVCMCEMWLLRVSDGLLMFYWMSCCFNCEELNWFCYCWLEKVFNVDGVTEFFIAVSL